MPIYIIALINIYSSSTSSLVYSRCTSSFVYIRCILVYRFVFIVIREKRLGVKNRAK
jgi:hypothetical protein